MNQDPALFSKQIQKMFSAIAPRYDLLNSLLSCGRDKYWRKIAVNSLSPQSGDRLLDLATGTADVALEIAGRDLLNLNVIGVDFSFEMLQLGRKKIHAKKMEKIIRLQSGTAEHLAFANGTFNGIVTAFGIRNFSNIDCGLQEMWRVLKRKGKIVILEFSLPENIFFKSAYRIYFDHLLPWVGKYLSGHQTAYSYLPKSVWEFPSPTEFAQVMQKNGFQDVAFQNLTFGIATVYTGYKHV